MTGGPDDGVTAETSAESPSPGDTAEIAANDGEGATANDGEETADGDADEEPAERDDVGSHLDDVDPGCGCAEVWETMSEQRSE
ncbi:hypothetical protein RYH80_16950 [Halobaculum sp. MBLA0147]|uniref:hypothetical protein n=1 Tax=Halobaculum sp. MBLA0147 TaxID=3079934 RepID=UPI003525B6DC